PIDPGVRVDDLATGGGGDDARAAGGRGGVAGAGVVSPLGLGAAHGRGGGGELDTIIAGGQVLERVVSGGVGGRGRLLRSALIEQMHDSVGNGGLAPLADAVGVEVVP